nr:hypothetical protein [Candidatus Methylomirabilis sp.]
GEAAPEEAAEPAIGLQDCNVVETVATRGEKQDQSLDLLDLRVPALPLAPADLLADQPEIASETRNSLTPLSGSSGGSPGGTGNTSAVLLRVQVGSPEQRRASNHMRKSLV